MKMKKAEDIKIYYEDETGTIILENEIDKYNLSQMFEESQIFWGEHGGYFVHIEDQYLPLEDFVL
ncbi:hypothetical protein [Alkalibacter saccharofermentans]|uniref:Uncharacterized protein n=1 Tax=Alkalibacter saccharofermentans DSM 14828 TaxID=1120975 RepID=A0A1M4VLS3_9FIRM|nr:hypothetical protein [Alkalibacter saccharofermentans]SHE69974.1 hypothetical protein SAMN02746064_01041 [Alkalibacter saccharofermentans DSM 14828]